MNNFLGLLILICTCISFSYSSNLTEDEITPMKFQLEKTISKATDDDGAIDADVEDDDGSDDFQELHEESKKSDDYYYSTPKSHKNGPGNPKSDAEDDDDEDEAEHSKDNDYDATRARKLQGQFDAFKSYANARVKPPQYAKKNLRHSTSEYLTQNQMYMMKMRTGPDDPAHSFSASWSGFNK